MKILKDLLYKTGIQEVSGTTDVEVSQICFDSRKIAQGCVFVAIRGTQSDGHRFIEQAIQHGALAIVCEDLPVSLSEHITYIRVKNSNVALAYMASNYYENPSSKLKLVGITGTNGKTTTATLLFRWFRAQGFNTGLLSTVRNQVNEEIIPSTHTTPDSLQLNALLAHMVDEGCTHCFMEVSSHAVVQHRVTGIEFAGGIFTNLTHDHLDYHKTFDEYLKAKKTFFDMLGSHAFALINADDRASRVMVQNTNAVIKTYALKSMSDYKGKILENSFSGLQMNVDGRETAFRLIGSFNAYNLLAVYGAAILLGHSPEEVLTGLSLLEPVEGRFEYVVSQNNIIGIVDYAHTPDALRNVLSTIKDIRTGNEKVITVVGCGGNRDAAKRPVMAQIACDLSDKVILTSDNPRNEEPPVILEQMQQGVPAQHFKKTISVLDRREAIKAACAMAEKGDIILLAGKGHEKYQEIKGVKYPFDDKEILKETLNLFAI